MPEKALEVFATKLSALFEAIDLQLQPVTSKLSADSPAIDGLSKVLTATGHPGVADKITEVMDAMSKQVQAYEKTLSSSADVADGLKNLTKDDWHKAGPKIEELKKYLDTGASAIKSFGDTLQAKVEEALTVLAGSLGVEASVFSPISQAAGDGWHYLGDSSTALAAGIVSSSQMLPPEIKDLTRSPTRRTRGPPRAAPSSAPSARRWRPRSCCRREAAACGLPARSRASRSSSALRFCVVSTLRGAPPRALQAERGPWPRVGQDGMNLAMERPPIVQG
ncbi:unnamed protein product [Prorocentrum cordatum]|uniref:Uncharacterized protein n=1 Tax=Prorocentrum cordatum TaxID=2364126 RepID=A0ABN9R0I6_9DINO|nr:unnamed protein product [Polarella glacialis]